MEPYSNSHDPCSYHICSDFHVDNMQWFIEENILLLPIIIPQFGEVNSVMLYNVLICHNLIQGVVWVWFDIGKHSYYAFMISLQIFMSSTDWITGILFSALMWHRQLDFMQSVGWTVRFKNVHSNNNAFAAFRVSWTNLKRKKTVNSTVMQQHYTCLTLQSCPSCVAGTSIWSCASPSIFARFGTASCNDDSCGNNKIIFVLMICMVNLATYIATAAQVAVHHLIQCKLQYTLVI